LKRVVVRDGIVVEDREQRALLRDVGEGDPGVEVLERLVVGRAEESERRNQRAGADARYDLESGPCARLRPAIEYARAERAVIPSAGNGELRSGWEHVEFEIGLFPLEGLQKVALEFIDVDRVTGEVTKARGEIGHVGFDREIERHGLSPLGRGTTLSDGDEEDPEEETRQLPCFHGRDATPGSTAESAP
jgi:hypothetical protein